MGVIENLEGMLAQGRDSALLRYGLGHEYLKRGDPRLAVTHFRQAVALDAQYSAAWKLLAQALAESGAVKEAAETYRRGIEVAQARGDIQAAKEMQVFLRRLEKASP